MDPHGGEHTCIYAPLHWLICSGSCTLLEMILSFDRLYLSPFPHPTGFPLGTESGKTGSAYLSCRSNHSFHLQVLFIIPIYQNHQQEQQEL